MTSCIQRDNAVQKNVGMGQIAMARGPATLTAILGSCIGVAIYHPRTFLGALAHVVLPESHDRGGLPGKFANTAIPHMLDLFRQEGAGTGLIAKIAGGACMFGSGGPLQIGEDNARAVAAALEAAGVRIIARDVGGTNGRRATLHCVDGSLSVAMTGTPARIL